jgi:hypothetical protein
MHWFSAIFVLPFVEVLCATGRDERKRGSEGEREREREQKKFL